LTAFPSAGCSEICLTARIQRNIGSSLAHCLLGYQSLIKGLSKISLNKKKVEQDLEANWNILAEAAQTMARKSGDELAYEKIAALVKQKSMGKEEWV
jgi:adenylosuccinate lyase